MRRIWALAVLASACATTETRHVSKFRMPHGGTCPDDTGCEAPVATEARYELPDSGRPAAADRYATAPPAVPKEATCALVGAELASHALGNYAAAEQVEPVVAQHEARCRRLALTLEERTCIVTAHGDPPSLEYCAPRMFAGTPTVTIIHERECAELGAGARAKMTGLRDMTSGERRVLEAKLDVFAASCEHDRWTEPFAACLRGNAHAREPLMPCLSVAPLPLRTKIDERLKAAMRKLGG